MSETGFSIFYDVAGRTDDSGVKSESEASFDPIIAPLYLRSVELLPLFHTQQHDVPVFMAEESANRKRGFFRRNWFGILSFALSAVLAVSLFYAAQDEVSVVYFLSETQAIVDGSSGSDAPIQVYDTTGNRIDGGVYLRQVTLWNDGDLAVEPSTVRQPVRLVVKPSQRILEARIAKQTHPEIAEVRVEIDSTVGAPLTQAAIVHWNHFDPGFATRIQLIYQGTGSTTVDVQGYILGDPDFGEVDVDAKYRDSNSSIWLPFFAGLAFLLVTVATSIFMKSATRGNTGDPDFRSDGCISVILSAIILSLMLAAWVYFNTPPQPPI